jgi:ferritin
MPKTKLLTTKGEALLNSLVTVELTASHVYKQLAAKCDEMGYLGAYTWYKKQYEEEAEHAQKVMDYINDRGGCVHIEALPKVDMTKCGLRDVLERTMIEEIKVEKAWREAYDILCKENDSSSKMLAQEFLAEQIAEIGTVGDLIAQYDSLGDSAIAIHAVDVIMRNRA